MSETVIICSSSSADRQPVCRSSSCMAAPAAAAARRCADFSIRKPTGRCCSISAVAARSRPLASVEANTTWHLVEDIERIRHALDIDRWILFGGSWGAALGLIYAQRHPQHVAALILRGVFTMTQAELDWFYAGGAARFLPEHWQAFAAPVPEAERADLIAAYGRRLFGNSRAEQILFARAWFDWEDAASSLSGPMPSPKPSDVYVQTFARIENHYFANRGFLDRDDLIMSGMAAVRDIPGRIVQGRYDMVCPPRYRLPAGRLLAGGKTRHRSGRACAFRTGHCVPNPQRRQRVALQLVRTGILTSAKGPDRSTLADSTTGESIRALRLPPIAGKPVAAMSVTAVRSSAPVAAGRREAGCSDVGQPVEAVRSTRTVTMSAS